MGLEMNNLHTPSAAGASQGAGDGASDTSAGKSLLELISDRENLEAELSALGGVLVSHGVDMNTPLLTSDGFPRNDIDVPQIRTTRARIIWLRNDYKALMSKIEAGLHAHHAALQAGTATPSVTAGNPSSSSAAGASYMGEPSEPSASGVGGYEPPFAKVNSVVTRSPADVAGLQAGDEVRRFGSANWANHEKLGQVAQIVQRNEGREILVKVKRKTATGQAQEVALKLIPQRNWGGRGLLGCHLVPL